jgi:proteasome accessory factor B
VSGPALPGVEVTLAVAPEARWAVEVRGGRDTGRTHDGWPVLTLDDLHPVRDRAWVLGLGPAIEVLGPAAAACSGPGEGLAARSWPPAGVATEVAP